MDNEARENGQVNLAYSHRTSSASLSLDHRPDLETSPRIDHYSTALTSSSHKSGRRPTLLDLHREIILVPGEPVGDEFDKQSSSAPESSTDGKKVASRAKFGWIIGVLIRCTLNILGALLYLRLTWMSGQCGIGLASLMILLSAVVTVLTSLSMCAICTNGEIKGGGAYFMLSRALGPEFGGSMGLIFSLANAVAVALHITGFSETVRDIMHDHQAKIVDGAKNDIRIVSILTLCLLMGIVILGISVEVKAQIVLLIILAASYVVYVAGTFLPPSHVSQARGVTGYKWQTFKDNFGPSFRGEDFFSVLAIYFPAATGIMAGANISGDLRDPSSAIPKGTLLAILITSGVYLSAIWMAGATVIRDASGDVMDLVMGTVSDCAQNTSCEYGLMNYSQTMQMQSACGPLIIAGIFAASLSSALACLVSGPKLFQAVGRDKLFPKLEWFAHGYGKGDEPRRAYALGFVISFAVACAGDLNEIAPFISNFYLATYALINFACFHGSIAKSPGWRPAFKYYNRWLSCLGAFLCIAAMFMMSYYAAPLTFGFAAVLYIYLSKRKPDVNWGSSNQAHQYVLALQSMHRLLRIEAHVKNYRPQILALTGNPASRPSLVDFAKGITYKNSLLILGHVVRRNEREPNWRVYEILRRQTSDAYAWLKQRRVKAFYQPVTADTMRDGLKRLLEGSGLGKMRPNIVILGYKNRWNSATAVEVKEYFELIHECFDADMAVCILRVSDGLDYGAQMLQYNVAGSESIKPTSAIASLIRFLPAAYRASIDAVMVGHHHRSSILERAAACNNGSFDQSNSVESGYNDGHRTCSVGSEQLKDVAEVANSEKEAESNVIEIVNRFRTSVRGTVDVWWLVDDGGLALLIPHLLVNHKTYLHGSKLRIFTTGSNENMIKEQQKNMVALLAKFRISAADVTVINSADKAPSQATVDEFEALISTFKAKEKAEEQVSNVFINEEELVSLKDRTNQHLRIRELLVEHSAKSSLIVITLPVPRKNGVSAYLYVSWLETLTSFTKSPVLLVRGNQQSVLTFDS